MKWNKLKRTEAQVDAALLPDSVLSLKMGFVFICNLRPAWHLQPAELCLEMQATAGQRANQSKTEKEKTNL